MEPAHPTFPLTGSTVAQLLEKRAALHPERLALVAASGRGGEERLTYSALYGRAIQLADGLRQQGIRKGDHLGLLLANSAGIECIVTQIAAARLGVVLVPLNTRYAAEQLAYTLNNADCRALIYGQEFAALFERVADRCPKITVTFVVGSGHAAPRGAYRWQDVLESGAKDAAGWPEVAGDDVSDIIFTSGTTAHPKGVLMTHARALACGNLQSNAMRVGEGGVLQSALPFFTSSGCHLLSMASWLAGATWIMEPTFDAVAALQRLERERTNVYLAVPSILHFLTDVIGDRQPVVPDLRVITYGGSLMPGELIERLLKLFPGIDLRNLYGMTETGPSGTVLPGAFLDRKPGSVGQPMQGCSVKIINEQGREIPNGEIGEIAVLSPSAMVGYYNNPTATADALVNGWIHTGDIGRFDSEGFLYYVDRKKDIIIRGGHNISSIEVEDALLRHPDVAEAAVIGIAHPRLGEDVQAFVVLRDKKAVTFEELREFCKEYLADYCIPRNITFRDTLPRNSMGKLTKAVLRDLIKQAS